MSSMVAKRVLLRPIFRVGKTQKSLGARSEEYGGWVMTRTLFSATNCCTTSDVRLGALSWCRNHSPFHLLHRFLRTASRKHSCHHPTTVLFGSRSEWLLAVPYSEMGLKGTHFATMEDIKSNATAELWKIPKEAFRRFFQQWKDWWSKCVCAQGSYFEGDKVSVVKWPTITVLYHISGNFLTAPHIII